MTVLRRIAGPLVIVGAINWGLVAIAEFDLVAWLFGLDFGETNAATRVIYGLVGISGLVLAATAIAGSAQTQHGRTSHPHESEHAA